LGMSVWPICYKHGAPDGALLCGRTAYAFGFLKMVCGCQTDQDKGGRANIPPLLLRQAPLGMFISTQERKG